MNLNELNYILCIAKHQNLTKAARELYISQPTLSKFLQKTERELDTKLFHRIDNGYVPTPIGRQYLNYAKKMLDLQNDWEKELMDLKEMNTGELNIAFPLMRSSCLIPKVLPLFHEKHPGIRLNFLEETYAIQEKLLLDDTVDFAIFSESSPHPRLCYEEIGKEEILLVCSHYHPLGKEGVLLPGRPHPYIPLEVFEKESFILHFPEQTTGKIARNLLSDHGISPEILFQTRNTQAAIESAALGVGVCFAPETYISHTAFAHPPQCFSVVKEGIYSPVILAYRKGMYLTSYARDFIDLVGNMCLAKEWR